MQQLQIVLSSETPGSLSSREQKLAWGARLDGPTKVQDAALPRDSCAILTTDLDFWCLISAPAADDPLEAARGIVVGLGLSVFVLWPLIVAGICRYVL